MLFEYEAALEAIIRIDLISISRSGNKELKKADKIRKFLSKIIVG